MNPKLTNPFRGISQIEIERAHKRNKERDRFYTKRIKKIMKKIKRVS